MLKIEKKFGMNNYLDKIFETQPWETRSCLEISQGRTPLWANSTILCLTTSGRGLPLTNTPPSWFTPPWPENNHKQLKYTANQNYLTNAYKYSIRYSLRKKIFFLFWHIFQLSFNAFHSLIKFRLLASILYFCLSYISEQ